MPPSPAAAPAAAFDESVVAQLDSRVAALERLFEQVGATRMRGLPMVHPGLAVKALGFEVQGDGPVGPEGPAGCGAVGVLVTPWCMNLLWLPLHADGDPQGSDTPALRPGASRTRAVGCERFDFIGAFESSFGAYETCSLFSPMFEFADQASALATARQVLAILRAPQAAADEAPARAARRALLFGRGQAALPAGAR